MKKKSKFSIKNIKLHWAWYLVLIFLSIRFFINMEFTYLSIFFAITYFILFLLLIAKSKYFITFFVIFLAIDNMIGTYLASTILGFDYVYFGTIIINFIIMIVLLRDKEKNFKI